MEPLYRRLIFFLIYKLKNGLHPKALVWWFKRTRRPGQPIITRMMNGLKVRIYPEDVIGRDIFVHGVFEPKESRFVSSFLKSGMVFFDVGANLGQYTLLGAQAVGPQGKVHSFEPSKRMFSELSYNVALNGLYDRCHLNRVAIANKPGLADIPVYKPGAEVYTSLGNCRVDQYLTDGWEQVSMITLEDYCEEHKISTVDLIKMDIEGAELLALQGAQKFLSKADAPTILLEVGESLTKGFGYHGKDIWDFLMARGYRMHLIQRNGSIIQAPPDNSFFGNFVAQKINP
jgi:FkbM family methyltransferase